MKYKIVFVLIFLISFYIRIAPISNNNIGFAYDQARDMLDIRHIVIGQHLTLIGPTTSINGVFLGPFWYYFNTIPFILGSGNPIFLVYWSMAFFQMAGLLLFIFFKKSNLLFALLISIFFLMSPTLFNLSRVSWSANPMPIFMVLFFISLFSNLEKPTSLKIIFLGLIIGLSLQIEAAFSILLLPFTLILYFIKKIHVKYLLLLGLSFGATLIPQVLFELKHNFLMTNVLIKEMTGKTTILGEKLSFTQSFTSHLNSYTNSTNNIFGISDNLINYLLIFAVIFLIVRIVTKKIDRLNKQYFLISISFIIYSFISYLMYAQHLKSWYLFGLIFPFLLIIAVFFNEILRLRNRGIKLVTSLIIAFVLINTITKQIDYIHKATSERSTDQNNLRNQLETVDWVYQSAKGEGFKVFSYFPSVYDFPYQYLFWWYGTYKYSYQPNTISYLDNVPEYIPSNNIYLTKKRQLQENYKTFLIIQDDKDRPERRLAWLDNFKSLCLKEKKEFIWNTEVWVKDNCTRKSTNI